MDRKTIGLIVLLVIVKCSTGDEPYCLPPISYGCFPGNPSIVQYSGHNFSCPTDQICNRYNMYPNDPCVHVKTMCNMFECDPKSPKDINFKDLGFTLNCAGDYVCNENYTYPCNPCVMKSCPPAQYTCDKNDETLVIITNIGIPFKCTEGLVCNKDNIQPCHPCVKRGKNVYSFDIDGYVFTAFHESKGDPTSELLTTILENSVSTSDLISELPSTIL